jgi:hypothetical protein
MKLKPTGSELRSNRFIPLPNFAARITGAICCHRKAYNSYIDKRLGS